jgi:TetR/AcrR family transcriptional regulator, transcriptional repressor for nem operon
MWCMPKLLTAKGQVTRARIVQAAAELVAEKGAAATSLDDVCDRAHASRSQLYHYFDDRDDLLRAVIDATTNAVLLAQDGLLDHLDTWTGIDRWFRALVALQQERDARGGCPIGSLVGQLAERDPGARENLADGFERWEGHLRAGLQRMQERGRLSARADPAALATSTMALIQGGLLLTQVRRDPEQLRTALAAARVLLRAAAA